MIQRCRQWLVRVLSPADNKTELYRFETTAPTKRLAILNVRFGSEPECRAAFGHTIKVSPIKSRYRVEVLHRNGWAGNSRDTWQPGIAGTLNQTGMDDEDASTFSSMAEAKEAERLCASEGATRTRIVRV